LVVDKSISLPLLLNFIPETSAVSPPTKNVSKGPYRSTQPIIKSIRHEFGEYMKNSEIYG
jgi:hypothetical protein